MSWASSNRPLRPCHGKLTSATRVCPWGRESAGCCHAGNAISDLDSYWNSLTVSLEAKRAMVDTLGVKLVAKDGTPYEVINPNGLYASGFLIPSWEDPTVPMVDDTGATLELKVFLNVSSGLGSLNIVGFDSTGFPLLTSRVGDDDSGFLDMSASDLQELFLASYNELTNNGANSLNMLVGGSLLSQEYITQGTQHFGYWTDGIMVASGAAMAAVSDLAVTDVSTIGLVFGPSFISEDLVCVGKAGQWLSSDGRHASDTWARFTIEQTGAPVCFGRIMDYDAGSVSVDGQQIRLDEIF